MSERFEADRGRLDAVVAARMGITRAEAQRVIAAGGVLVDGSVRARSYRLAGGERVQVDLARAQGIPAEGPPLALAYRDEHLAVVRKPAGLATHPTENRRSGTVVNRLLGMGVPLAPRRRRVRCMSRARSPSAPPPMRMRAAPTEAASASGPSACAVPVVPKHTEARRTARTKRIQYCYTIRGRRRKTRVDAWPSAGRVGSRMSRATCGDGARGTAARRRPPQQVPPRHPPVCPWTAGGSTRIGGPLCAPCS